MGTAEFMKINWLPFEHRVALIKLNLVYRVANGSTPEYEQTSMK